MPKSHFSIACGAPIRQKKHLSADTILTRLKQANVVEEVEVGGVGPCIVYAEYEDALADINTLKARLIAEDILLKQVGMWARNLGIVSFEKVSIRDGEASQPRVGTFAWDLTGPSYLSPMVQWDKDRPSPGFIACDVLLGPIVTELGIGPFIHKCLTLRNLKKVGRVLPIFVATNYTTEAFSKAKSIGVIPATPESLFGKEVAEGLNQLIEVLVSAAKASTKPEVFNLLFQRLGKIEGAANNLRGALFEYLVAELVRQTISATITLNRTFRDETCRDVAEVDVLAVESKKAAYFIECKGYQPSGTIDEDDVERWLNKRVHLIRQYALKHPDWKNLELHFEFWTTGKLTEAAKAKIIAADAGTSKYTVRYRDAAGVLAYALETKDKALVNTLNQHFLQHPLARAELDARLYAVRKEHAAQAPNQEEDISSEGFGVETKLAVPPGPVPPWAK